MRFLVVACLASFVCGAFAKSAKHPDNWRLVRVSDDVEFWASPEQIDSLAMQEIGFADVTDTYDLESFGKQRAFNVQSYPTSARQQTLVQSLISDVNMNNFMNTLTTFTNFTTRDRRTTQGVQSAQWLQQQAQSRAGNVARVTTFANSQFNQFNVIARIEGDGSDNNLIVIGAHQDSIAGAAGNRAPGADDDGSGSMMLLELLRIFVNKINAGQFRSRRPIEFQWYAGEEGGLVGSRNIAQDYARRNVNVYSMVQFDMIGYPSSFNTGIGTITDSTNGALTQFTRMLIDTYLTIGWENGRCGYGCSDHASFHSAGYPAAFPFEAPFGRHNNQIHTSRDTIANGVNMQRATQFHHLGVAYLVEAGLA